MKCPRLAALVVFSLCNCHLYAVAGELPHARPPVASSAVESSSADGTTAAPAEFMIPGPLRSLERMAGISQQVTPDEVMPLLSRNVFSQGFEVSTRPTEFLILLRRYMVQARELNALAANSGMTIHVSNCAEAQPLLHILGYRVRATCGEPGTLLQTDDPERAFLSIDSGFPLPELERTLQGGKPFEYHYPSSPVPVMFADSDWTMASKKNYKESSNDLIDTILNDEGIARLYWALSKLDPETSRFLQRSIGIKKLLPYAAVLDFYGRELCINGDHVLVPGGTGAEAAWSDLVGGSPASPAQFVEKLLARDRGWLAAYFDAISRTSQPQQVYFTDSRRLRRFYDALRTPNPNAKATRGSFRPAPGLVLLTARLQFDSNGQPHVPGNLAVWRDILLQARNTNVFSKSEIKTGSLKDPDHLVQVMFALSRVPTDSGPLQVFMALSELDTRRSPEDRLAPETVRLLARKFEDFSDQYKMFSEFPELTDKSIAKFMEVVQDLNGLPMSIRGNAFGTFQANVGIWQILARQGQISTAHLNDSWQETIKPFASIRSAPQLYDAGRTSLGELFQLATGKTRPSQDEIVDLLAGPRQTTEEGMRMHREVADRIRAVMADQRLVSLDTLLTLGDALHRKSQGTPPEDFIVRLASETREFEMPQPIFSNGERSEWAAGVFNDHHTEVQMRTDVAKVLKSSTASRGQIEDARGQLASFLRDTLVGLNYAYYEPPGSQALHNNPLFVRSHDFAGETVSGMKTLWQAPELLGQGTPAGGGAHFVGSLADLPYALAEIEQDFISPDNVQALIWRELTPELLTSAILPRWWNVTPTELHAVALYQRAGEELLTASATDDALRGKVLTILSGRLLPERLRRVEMDLRARRAAALISQMMPADTFYLEVEFQRKYPGEASHVSSAAQELQELTEQHPEQVNWKKLSHDFGTPHPSLAGNYGLELLNVAPMPPFSGYSSRFLAESWDSPNLYWARLADEAGYPPVALNRLIPELTRLMIAKTFATDLEDWPALLRAMHEAGKDFRDGKIGSPVRLSSARP